MNSHLKCIHVLQFCNLKTYFPPIFVHQTCPLLDHRELRVHPAEPVVQVGCGDVSGAADGIGGAGRGSVHRCQREGCGELRLLGQEEKEKEEPRSGGPGVFIPAAAGN